MNTKADDAVFHSTKTPLQNSSQESTDKMDFLLELQAVERTSPRGFKIENQRQSVVERDLLNWFMFFGTTLH